MKSKRKNWIVVPIILVIVLALSSCNVLNNKYKGEPVPIAYGLIKAENAETEALGDKAKTVSAVIGANVIVLASIGHTNNAGSGFIIDKERGLIATNAHVVFDSGMKNPAKLITVKLLNKKFLDGDSETNQYIERKATLEGYNKIYDVAILKIDSSITKAIGEIKFSKADNFVYGQETFFIGNPEGIGISVSNSMVANPNYIMSYSKNFFFEQEVKIAYVQIDGNVNHGNSGGAMYDLKGNAMGIVSMRRENTGETQAIVQGIGFVLRSDEVIKVLTKLYEKKGWTVTETTFYG